MPTARRTCSALFLACLAPLAQAEVYQWKDEAGTTVFGDRPPRGQARDVQQINEASLQSPAAAAAEEALFRERERRLLQAMARDAAEREKLRAEMAGDADQRRISRAVRCASVRAEVEGAAAPDAQDGGTPGKETFGEKVAKAPLRNFLARHCGDDV